MIPIDRQLKLHIFFNILDTLSTEMEFRFSNNISDLLLMVPSVMISPCWRHKEELWKGKVLKAIEPYQENHLTGFSTELAVWTDYW